MPQTPNRTRPCTSPEAAQRSRIAAAYLEAAESILAERAILKEEYRSVATGLAVLAGIAASDAICGRRLKKVHRGDNHRDAVELLQSAVPDGRALARKLSRLLDLKDEAHYGIQFVSGAKSRDAVKAAKALVEASAAEQER